MVGPRGRSPGPRRRAAGVLPGDGRAARPGAHRRAATATARGTTSGWGARPPTPSGSPSCGAAPAADGVVSIAPCRRRCEMVFFDIGGVMYDDSSTRGRGCTALRELGRGVHRRGVRRRVRGRARGAGGLVPAPAARARFLGRTPTSRRVGGARREALGVPAHALYADVDPVPGGARRPLPPGRSSRTSRASVKDGDRNATGSTPVLRGVGGRATTSGCRSPIPRCSRTCSPPRASRRRGRVMVGDRLDYDVRPAKAAGMRAVWVLRGEAPDDPTPEQLAEADAAIRALDELADGARRRWRCMGRRSGS